MSLYDTTFDLHMSISAVVSTKYRMSCDPGMKRLIDVEIEVERMTMLEMEYRFDYALR